MNDVLPLDPVQAWELQTFPHDRQLTAALFSSCGKFLFAAGMDQGLHRWDLATGEKQTFAGHATWIMGLTALGSDRIVSVDWQGGVRCWNVADGAAVWSVPAAGPDKGWTRCVAATRDGSRLATAGTDRIVRLWNPADGTLLQELEPHPGDVFSLAFHPDGQALVSGDLFGNVRHWDADGKVVRTLEVKALHTRGDEFEFIADVGGVRALAFDAAGGRLACGGLANAKSNTFCPGDPSVVLLDWATGQVGPLLAPKTKSDGPVNALCWLADGTLAGCTEGSGGGALAFWKPDQAAQFQPLHAVGGSSGYAVALHPDGRRLAVPTFVQIGHGGNGRGAKNRAEYLPHHTAVRVFALYKKA